MYSEDETTSRLGEYWGWIERNTLNEKLTNVWRSATARRGQLGHRGREHVPRHDHGRGQVERHDQADRRRSDEIEKNLIQEERHQGAAAVDRQLAPEGLHQGSLVRGEGRDHLRRSAGIGPEVVRGALASDGLPRDIECVVIGVTNSLLPGSSALASARHAIHALEEAVAMAKSERFKRWSPARSRRRSCTMPALCSPGRPSFCAAVRVKRLRDVPDRRPDHRGLGDRPRSAGERCRTPQTIRNRPRRPAACSFLIARGSFRASPWPD